MQHRHERRHGAMILMQYSMSDTEDTDRYNYVRRRQCVNEDCIIIVLLRYLIDKFYEKYNGSIRHLTMNSIALYVTTTWFVWRFNLTTPKET